MATYHPDTAMMEQYNIVLSTPTKRQIHPVYQLEHYLRSVANDDDDTNHQERRKHSVDEAKYDEILRVADFLFGNTLLVAALTLLDHPSSTFTKISSIHRSLWLVRGSGDVAYMCFVCGSGDPLSMEKEETPNLYFCNCRSFLEKTTKRTPSEQELPELCKHLLALKLIPALGISCPQLTVSDYDLAKLVIGRTLKGKN